MEYENLNEIFKINRVNEQSYIKEYDISQFFNNGNNNDANANTYINEYVDNKSYNVYENLENNVNQKQKEEHQNNINEILNTRRMLMRQAQLIEATKVDFNVDFVSIEMFMKLSENKNNKIKEQVLILS